jgi:hypothetical protein
MADDKTNPNATGQVDDDDGQTDDASTGGDDDDTGDDGDQIVFENQDALDKFVGKRLKRDRRTRRAEEAAGKAVDKAEKDADKADNDDAASEKAKREADAKVVKAQSLAARASALVAAADAGLAGARAKAAVKLADLNLADVIDDDGEVDEDAVTDAVNDAIKAYPFLTADDAPADEDGKPRKRRVGGKTPKKDGDKDTDAVSLDRFKEMDYRERVQLYNRDPQLYEELSKKVA